MPVTLSKPGRMTADGPRPALNTRGTRNCLRSNPFSWCQSPMAVISSWTGPRLAAGQTEFIHRCGLQIAKPRQPPKASFRLSTRSIMAAVADATTLPRDALPHGSRPEPYRRNPRGTVQRIRHPAWGLSSCVKCAVRPTLRQVAGWGCEFPQIGTSCEALSDTAIRRLS